VVDRPGDVIYIIDQAIVPELRNQGLGTAIMRAHMEEARAAGVPLRLMAAQGDPAMRLYARLGFTVGESETPMYSTLEWRPAAAEDATRC
jgi:ribosomal protein S18 acetylase RimI-like enzyme